ncbi:hypothetical protein HY967_03685 [Candidatus Jorgensenbacteria bacterium]|nr:hypothetical protein [Candidatus Jorgensenbacteria bacterium]
MIRKLRRRPDFEAVDGPRSVRFLITFRGFPSLKRFPSFKLADNPQSLRFKNQIEVTEPTLVFSGPADIEECILILEGISEERFGFRVICNDPPINEFFRSPRDIFKRLQKLIDMVPKERFKQLRRQGIKFPYTDIELAIKPELNFLSMVNSNDDFNTST